MNMLLLNDARTHLNCRQELPSQETRCSQKKGFCPKQRAFFREPLFYRFQLEESIGFTKTM